MRPMSDAPTIVNFEIHDNKVTNFTDKPIEFESRQSYDWTGITDPMTVTELRELLVAAISGEFSRAKQLYPRPFVNAHEAHSVIREEFDEWEREVYRKCGERNAAVFRNELIQLAAMCIRTLVEVDPHAP